MAIFIAFVTLLVLTFARTEQWVNLKAKSWQDWLLDGIGLCFQGILIPALQIVLIYQVYQHLLPENSGILNFHPLLAFGLSFVGVDYLYYWNHRLLHSRGFWRLHLVHHTMTERQVLGTSRNTLWTSFLIVYLWIHALFIYLLQDPTAYIIGVSLTSILDLWRHSEIEPQPGTMLHRFLSPWLILPMDHAWHHARESAGEHLNLFKRPNPPTPFPSREGGERGHRFLGKIEMLPSAGVNYGANLKLWDRLHGTNYDSNSAPDALGISTNLNLVQKLIWPF